MISCGYYNHFLKTIFFLFIACINIAKFEISLLHIEVVMVWFFSQRYFSLALYLERSIPEKKSLLGFERKLQ